MDTDSEEDQKTKAISIKEEIKQELHKVEDTVF